VDHILQQLTEYWPEVGQTLVVVLLAWLVLRRFRQSTGMRVFLVLAGSFLVAFGICALLELQVMTFVVKVLAFFSFITLIVVFQPELRRTVSELGSRGFLFFTENRKEFIEQLEEVVKLLSAKRFGALIALERGIDLRSHLETGVTIEAKFSNELLLTIFHPRTALHDGGMILRDGKVRGAACVFPVSQRELLDRSIGLRHRAGIGITEESDAIAVVVSEETGDISICHSGKLERGLSKEEFHKRLVELLVGEDDDEEEENEKSDAAAIGEAKTAASEKDRRKTGGERLESERKRDATVV
jgi:diadenylate cyclase